jgi:glycine betaine catabolism B
MALQPWRSGEVIRIEDHTHNTRQYWLRVNDAERFEFTPGQFVTLDLPIHEKPNKRIRSYSIASWPDNTNVFELLIVLAPHGTGTQYIFHEVKLGSLLKFRGAQGVFVLPEKLEEEIFMICTGTGIAPFRSMINHIYLHKIPFSKIHLIFGCRTQKDLLYHDEMKEMQEKLPGFFYYPTLSREEWPGHHGYVHPIYEKLCETRPSALFYLCGWKAMIDEAKERILAMGYDKKAVRQELYG